jgi:hypothetical protein
MAVSPPGFSGGAPEPHRVNSNMAQLRFANMNAEKARQLHSR